MPLRFSILRNLICLLWVLLPGCNEVTQVSNSGYGAFEADIEVLDADTVAIAWYDTRHSQAEIYLRLLDHRLEPISAEFRLSENNVESYEVDIVALGENIAASWYEIDASEHGVVKLGLAWSDSAGGQHDVYFQQQDVTGKPQSDIRQLSHTEADSLIPSINSFASGFVLTWNEVTVNAHDAQTNLSRSEIVVTLIE